MNLIQCDISDTKKRIRSLRSAIAKVRSLQCEQKRLYKKEASLEKKYIALLRKDWKSE